MSANEKAVTESLAHTQALCGGLLEVATAVVNAYDKGAYLEDLEDAVADLKNFLEDKGIPYDAS